MLVNCYAAGQVGAPARLERNISVFQLGGTGSGESDTSASLARSTDPALLNQLGTQLVRRKSEADVSTTVATKGDPAHTRTPISLRFEVTLPSVTATGRWPERGRMEKM